MKKRIFTMVMSLSLLGAAAVTVANTTSVSAVTQDGFEDRQYALKKYKTSNPATYAKYSKSCMNEIKDGAWTTTQIAQVVNDGYLAEYVDELVSLGYYIPTTTQNVAKANGTEVSTAGAGYSAVFNADFYYKNNVDLQKNIGNDATALLNHFITVGMTEGRQASAEFNLAAYKKNNPDLVAVFGDNNVDYYMHYMTSGKAEKRIAK